MKKSILFIAFSIFTFTSIFAQKKEFLYSNKLTVVTGLSQPLLLGGFNLAANYTTNCWVFEYSHGMNLNYSGVALKPAYRDNLVSLKSPYSTGAGAGMRLFAKPIISMDLRAEAKVHEYEAQLNDALFIEYTNFDLGAGLYTQIRPFGKKSNALKGFVIEPSLRYWANVGSTLEKDFQYVTNDDLIVVHKPYPLNFFINISIGYTLNL